MKLNIQIFKRKQREEAYKGKYLNGCKPEGTARKAVYISREKHKAVRRIAGLAGENGMTISGYTTVRSRRACTGRKATKLSDR